MIGARSDRPSSDQTQSTSPSVTWSTAFPTSIPKRHTMRSGYPSGCATGGPLAEVGVPDQDEALLRVVRLEHVRARRGERIANLFAPGPEGDGVGEGHGQLVQELESGFSSRNVTVPFEVWIPSERSQPGGSFLHWSEPTIPS